MADAAPRYDRRLLDAVARLDDRSVAIAETCRSIGSYAESIGVPRPSYVHLRRLIVERRALADRRRDLAVEALRIVHDCWTGRRGRSDRVPHRLAG